MGCQSCLNNNNNSDEDNTKKILLILTTLGSIAGIGLTLLHLFKKEGE